MQTLNGVGTILYGHRHVDKQDGSYVATKWVAVAYLPILPLASYRVRQTGEIKQTHAFIIYNSYTPYVIQKLPLDWQQVLITYALAWGLFLSFMGIFALAASGTLGWYGLALLVVFTIGLIVAKKRGLAI